MYLPKLEQQPLLKPNGSKKSTPYGPAGKIPPNKLIFNPQYKSIPHAPPKFGDSAYADFEKNELPPDFLDTEKTEVQTHRSNRESSINNQ